MFDKQVSTYFWSCIVCMKHSDTYPLVSVDSCVPLCVQFHFNPAQSVLVMEGEDLESVNTAMAKVSYINSRQFPTAGLRQLHITTTVQ